MNISLAKLKAIILYFSEHTNSNYLGKIKLMKLFYYLDFTHVKRYGTAVTGDTYFHLKNGPIPSNIMNMVSELTSDPETSKLSDDIQISTPSGTRMLKVNGLRKFCKEDEDLFAQSELETLVDVCEKHGEDSTDEIIESSHREAPWNETDFGQVIPYELAAHDPDSNFSEEEIRLLELVSG